MMRLNGRRRTIAVAVTGLGLVLMTACSGSDGGGPVDEDLRIAIVAEPLSLDPCDAQMKEAATVLRGNVLEPLMQPDPATGEIQPVLAESWSQVSDTEWEIELRSGVTFQDGTDFNAEAAAYSLNRMFDEELNCYNTVNFPIPFVSEAVDDDTLRITTESPDIILPVRLFFAVISSPAATPEHEKTSTPVGTGPYAFGDRVEGTSISLTRFDDYWDGAPAAATVEYLYRSDPTVRASMVSAGEADIAWPIAPESVTNDDRTKTYTENRVFYLRILMDHPPLDDIRVRKAIELAIDKETIVSVLMPEIGSPTDQLVTESVNGYIPDYEGPGFDPDEARRLIEEAKADGVDVGVQIEINTRESMFPRSDEVLQAIQQNLADVGLNVTITVRAPEVITELYFKPFDGQPANFLANAADNITGDASFSFDRWMGDIGCCSTINDPQINQMLRDAAQLPLGDERAAAYQEAALRAYTQVIGLVPISEIRGQLLLAPGVNYEPNGRTGQELHVADVTFGD